MTQALPATTGKAIASVRWEGRAPVINRRRLPEALVHRCITPADLIDAFVTDAGIIEPPYERTIRETLR